MDMDFSGVRWIEAKDNPYQVRVLDCRSVTGKLVSSSQDREVVDRFLSLRSLNPEEHEGQQPQDAVSIPCALTYPDPAGLEEGLNYRAEIMEDKWDIFHVGEYLYFLRSWTGMLISRAHLLQSEGNLTLDLIQVSAGMLSGELIYSVCQVDFLVKSHLYRREVPHPLPVELPEDTPSLVLFSFSQYGRWAFYGSFEDTSTIRII